MKQTTSAELERLPGFGGLPLADHSVDARMVAVMRTLLGLAALAIVYIDPPASDRLLSIVYGSLACYCVYGLAVCATVFHDRRLIPERALYWADVAFYGYLVMLTGGVSSVFFHFFFFAILVSSFSGGFREGLAVTVVS